MLKIQLDQESLRTFNVIFGMTNHEVKTIHVGDLEAKMAADRFTLNLYSTLMNLQTSRLIKLNTNDQANNSTLKLTLKGIEFALLSGQCDFYTAGSLCESLESKEGFQKALFFYRESGRTATGSGDGLAAVDAESKLREKCRARGVQI